MRNLLKDAQMPFLKIDAKTYKVAPESLFRAATIREARGDWSKSFDHLKLIAQAYTDYDFELVADSLMRISKIGEGKATF